MLKRIPRGQMPVRDRQCLKLNQENRWRTQQNESGSGNGLLGCGRRNFLRERGLDVVDLDWMWQSRAVLEIDGNGKFSSGVTRLRHVGAELHQIKSGRFW